MNIYLQNMYLMQQKMNCLQHRIIEIKEEEEEEKVLRSNLINSDFFF